MKDSLTNEAFSGYLINYDTHIYTFDPHYKPLYNDDTTSYAILQSTINVRGKAIDSVNGLYYYQNKIDKFSYLYKRRIFTADSINLGYVIILLSPKQNKSEALYPELFRQTSNTSFENNNYAYAVYNNRRLINNINNYAFTDTITNVKFPKTEYELRHKENGYNELWYNAGNNRVIVVARKDTSLLQYVTFFAYLFCIFIAVVLILHFTRHILNARFSWVNVKKLLVFNIRTQIHATIIFISLFSFIIIGVVTITFFITRFNSSNHDKLSGVIKIINSEISNYISNNLSYNQNFNSSDTTLENDIEKKIINISEIQNVDINFYDTKGNLHVSTQPVIYNNRILSSKMNPEAFNELHYDKNIEYTNKENIGDKFSYLSIYSPLKDERGIPIGYLNIPFLNSQKELDQEISDFLITLIDLNALIFLFAGGIALLVTNRITSSFSFIGKKMKQINLGRINEEIIWNKNDEIGELINEYNKMVQQLEASAQALARNEREEAWREMARQVAHEIKNPLTPMKLSIQYLQRSINDGYSDVKELSEKVAETLIEQIDQLSKIAGEFSQFANIGNVKPEIFDVNEVIASVVNLYKAYPRVDIKWEKDKGEFLIFSDKVQINRLFTNLIKNAIEASVRMEIKEIIFHDYKDGDNVIITITDKGTGIAEEMQQKIFVPNFTTKSSGTGLGLAICHNIVEKANGKIWFETKENEGTVFYVSLPLVKDILKDEEIKI